MPLEMATTFSSYLKAPLPQSASQFDSSPLVLPRKRSPSYLYYSSYGKSEGTPTPKTRKTRNPYSRPGFSSDPSSPTFYTTPPSAQVPRESSMEESGDESDDVYDQFDLGDFTKEEIKIYESMVGPGERLRDAALPETPIAQTRETSFQTSLASYVRPAEGSEPVRVLPEELYELVRAGISNAIEQAISENIIERNESTVESLGRIFMDKISAPTPQISHLIRTHGFVVHSSVSPNWIRRQELGDCRYPAGSLKWAQRHYEQDVYDLARCLGHSMDEAEGWALQAREFCSEKKHLKDETAKTEQLLAESNYGLRVEIDRMEAADKTKEQKSVQKDAKKARIADSKVQGKARRQAERENAQNSNDHQTGRPEEQEPWTSNVGHPLDDQALNEQDKPQQQRKKGRKRKTETFEHPPNVQALNDQDKPHQQRKKGRKRKSDHELPVQSEVPDEHDKHKKRRMDDRQDDNSKQTKSKKGGPEHSPFFQRSSGSKAKKDSVSVTAAVEGVSENWSPPADLPSTPVKKGLPRTIVSPPSDDSSPLSSLRSTPSLLSFDNEEVRSDNKRIIQLSYHCARSKPVVSTRKFRHDPTGLPTPASSPISLRDLNKRLLEGTIYQDGIALAKSEATATLSVPRKPRKRLVTVSPFFVKLPSKKPKASDKVSCIPFPPLQSTSFGLVQERLSHDPFRLLVAVIFLNKTRGSVALPVFYELMERYPTPADLAAANHEDVVEIFQHLGLQNQRAKKCINLAKAWLVRPPEKGKRYRVLHYPKRDDGKDVRPDEVIDDEDNRVAWEIGQLPGIGVYAIDSWRIFCRDELRGLSTGLPKELTPETKEEELQKEWTTVLAGDKELRAYLRWRWLRNGWKWDPVTGERRKADAVELAKATRGGVIYEGEGGDVLVGEVKGEEPNVVKAELGIEDDSGKQSGEVVNMITEPKAGAVPEKAGEEAEAVTAGP